MALKLRTNNVTYRIELDFYGEKAYFDVIPMPRKMKDKILQKYLRMYQSAVKEDATAEIDQVGARLERFLGCVVGWEGIVDLNDNPIPYSPGMAAAIFENNEQLADEVMERVEKLEQKHNNELEIVGKN